MHRYTPVCLIRAFSICAKWYAVARGRAAQGPKMPNILSDSHRRGLVLYAGDVGFTD
jgi:hypothetical protein